MIILSGTSFAYTPYRFLVYRISITRNTPCSYTITTVVFLSGAVIIRSYFAFFRKVFYTHSRQRLPDPTKSASQLFLCYYFLGRSAPEIQARRYASQLSASWRIGSGPPRPTFAPSVAGSPSLRSGLLRIATAGV